MRREQTMQAIAIQSTHHFQELVLNQRVKEAQRTFPNWVHTEHNCKIKVTGGDENMVVYVGSRPNYVISGQTGIIHGVTDCEAFDTIIPDYDLCYGTLDTVNDWDWSHRDAKFIKKE